MKSFVIVVALAVAVLAAAPRGFAAQGDCSQPVSTGSGPTATDCLFLLKAAVGTQTCDPACICDPTGEGTVSATDALVCLKKAVGQSVALNCPCGGTTTTSSTSTSSSSSSSTTSSTLLATTTFTTTTLPSTTTTTPTTTTTSTTTTTMGGGSQPALTAGDFPAVSPCSDRDTLPSDASFLAAINAADRLHLGVYFTQYDTDGLPEICGLSNIDNTLSPTAIEWDATRNDKFNVCNYFTNNVSDFWLNVPVGHGPDLCQTSNDTVTLAMPRAGIYRKDVCIEGGGNSYDARFRLTVSGPAVDQTWASLGVSRSDIRTCNGNTEIVTQADAKAFLTSSPADSTFTIKTGGSCSAGTERYSVETQIICVKKRASACPVPTFGDPPCFQ